MNVILDTTYFGHTFGALVLMDSVSKQVLSVDIVAYETNYIPHDKIPPIYSIPKSSLKKPCLSAISPFAPIPNFPSQTALSALKTSSNTPPA
ncbi:hypothetical protein QDY71_06685 [Kingella negevensis]|uniref:hypothetical protein n=1 Tax=Kingella negevensis TaxID=1522312 RepID=UPI000BA3361B|nr:hypothetical protein [Kingella negevensis]MDK4683549.1 hypothetical protein [Kingella negevensis]MDK4693535.1 hypothetical protein [Kingella negevensis]MDK4697433.1 hypothetical protein [Kingella negevensis]MDK4700148.1 hypothetical protein [Kingella negevensis]MDK4706661.1 hypothetical protein [Kingella negevensis]